MLGRSSFVGSRQPTLSSQLSEHPQSCGSRFEKAETRVRNPWFQDLMSGCESLLPLALQKGEYETYSGRTSLDLPSVAARM